MQNSIQWQCKTFEQLTINELYDAIKLRIDVFVVEQTCYYPDLDDCDRAPETLHLYCYQNNKMAAYLRILPKGLTYPDYVSIGRVVTAPSARGQGLAHQMMEKALQVCLQSFPNENIKISAQEYLEDFYIKHHFKRVSDMYLEDNIPHIAMIYQKPS